MHEKAQLFMEGSHQAVRLPDGYHFEGSEIYIRRDPETGDVILSRRQISWAEFVAEDVASIVPGDFMDEADRQQGLHDRDPFAGIGV